MISRKLIRSIVLLLFSAVLIAAPLASADSSHARIIRLSLVEGDVRFAAETHGDPLTDSNTTWSTAELNLPIRQGYVLSTDNGRAEVEFENGAMAFLKENTVVEFYDLSLHDGDRTTRIVLRQGSASFYVNPSGGDYFSVTGGDFTVEADGRSTFRLDNFDDGSTVETLKGHVSVLHKGDTKHLEKGQSLSVKAGDDTSMTIGRLSNEDDFDHWVSGRIDRVTAGTNATLQYTSSPYYASGFADLSTYGAWSSCGGYGFGWRPFGVGYGWSPFGVGQWIWDPSFGWTYLSSQPWGWAPYHYGGWLFDSSCGGWFYSPPYPYGFLGDPRKRFPPVVHAPRPIYHAVTGVFVRQGGKVGIVPMHPLDQKGKTPLNLEHGVFAPSVRKAAGESFLTGEPGAKWQTLKSAPREALGSSLVPTTPPNRVSRTVLGGNSGARVVSLSKDSSIAYDPQEHRFVNTNSPLGESAAANAKQIRAANGSAAGAGSERVASLTGKAAASNAGTPSSARAPERPQTTPSANRTPPSRIIPPPPAPRYSGGGASSGGRSGGSGGGSTYSGGGGGRSSSSASSGSSAHPASAPSSSGRPH
ncbi:MAG TPA: FecR family protein [Candidatus Udaeobacter sp.]|nr:FecR family protein [Candidatus Udaeobacter sp.]